MRTDLLLHCDLGCDGPGWCWACFLSRCPPGLGALVKLHGEIAEVHEGPAEWLWQMGTAAATSRCPGCWGHELAWGLCGLQPCPGPPCRAAVMQGLEKGRCWPGQDVWPCVFLGPENFQFEEKRKPLGILSRIPEAVSAGGSSGHGAGAGLRLEGTATRGLPGHRSAGRAASPACFLQWGLPGSGLRCGQGLPWKGCSRAGVPGDCRGVCACPPRPGPS